MDYEVYSLYHSLHEMKDNTANAEIFKPRIKEAWECIDQEHIRKLVASIPAQLNVYLGAEE